MLERRTTQHQVKRTLLNHTPWRLKSGYTLGGHIGSTCSPNYAQGSDEYWMHEALKVSMNGIGISNPNPPVGCVIVSSDGQLIAKGNTQAFRRKHAERVAFESLPADSLLENATAYVTLEPCSHQGFQSPCVELFQEKGISRVVVGCKDPNPVVSGEGLRRLHAYGKEVRLGVLEDEIKAWLFPFLVQQLLHRPIIALKWAQTLDGQLVDDQGHSKWITNQTSRSYAHWFRQKHDLIAVGGRTAIVDLPKLDVRDCAGPIQHQPIPVVIDPAGVCLSADETTFERLLQTTLRPNRKAIYLIRHRAFELAQASDRMQAIQKHPQLLIHELPDNPEQIISEVLSFIQTMKVEDFVGRPVQSLMVEGGPKLLSSFLKAGHGDSVSIFIGNKITAGKSGRVLLDRSLGDVQEFITIAQEFLDQDVLVEMVRAELAQKILYY